MCSGTNIEFTKRCNLLEGIIKNRGDVKMNFYVIIVLLLIFIFCGFMGRLLNKKSLIFVSLAMKFIVYVLVFFSSVF